MASGFWYLKDGRGFSVKVQWMIKMMEEIYSELVLNPEAQEFANYLSQYIPTEKYNLNGYGGFYNQETGENTMMEIDFREFTKENQEHFWKATQKRLNTIIQRSDSDDEMIIQLLKELLDMNKRANKGENPTELNHMRDVLPSTGKKSGPGWKTG